MKPARLVIFSDIDGTLVDHDTYNFDAARDCLAVLRQLGIPLVLASSKTSAEIIPFRRELGFEDCPAICENGAGLIEGSAEAGASAGDYARLREILDALPGKTRRHFRGFGDMSVGELIAATGLALEAAERARMREFSEPGLWSGSEEEKREFLDILGKAGVTATEGGRFLTLGFGTSKVDRMSEILMRYGNPVSLALGDAPNDIEMIEAADYGVIVANPAHAPLPVLRGEEEGRITRTVEPGPAGWSRAVICKLSELNILNADKYR